MEQSLFKVALKHLKSTAARLLVMAWCHQATSHCLNHSCPRSLPSYGVIRPQCEKIVCSRYCLSNIIQSTITSFDKFISVLCRKSIFIVPYLLNWQTNIDIGGNFDTSVVVPSKHFRWKILSYKLEKGDFKKQLDVANINILRSTKNKTLKLPLNL